MNQDGARKANGDSTVLSALVQAFSALSIFVFYFGWVSEDSYLRMFGLRATSLDFPFYYFLIQGLKVNFPYQIEDQLFTKWQVLAWLINLALVISALLGNTSKKFKTLVVDAPGRILLAVTFLLIVLFLCMHYVGSRAGHERAQSILESPGSLRAVTYEYKVEPKEKAKRFSGYLLLLTADRLYVLQPTSLQDKGIPVGQTAPVGVTIVPMDRLSWVKTAGYSLVK